MTAATGSRNAVRAYVAATVVVAFAALVISARFSLSPDIAPSKLLLGLGVFTAFGLGLQLAEHRLMVGSAKGSIAFLVYIAAAVAFGPTWSAVVAAISVTSAQLLSRNKPLKVAFNVSQIVLSALAGGWVYVWLGGLSTHTSFDGLIMPSVGLAITYFAVNSGAVSGVVALSERRSFVDVWIHNTWSLAVYDLFASGLGIAIGWVYITSGVLPLAGVVLPILFLRHTYGVNLQLQSTHRELLDLMVKQIEARDPYTSGHSQRVAECARIIARELGLHFGEIEKIATAALLHDVGKIFEEFAPILQKRGKLTAEEKLIMRTHPLRSAELVGTMTGLRGYVQDCVRHHHEHFDGTGYPYGLVGDDIPMGARIIMVADTADAMTTDRPYRTALSYDRLVGELRKHWGRQFDPAVVDAFCKSAAIRHTIQTSKPAPALVPRPAPNEPAVVRVALHS